MSNLGTDKRTEQLRLVTDQFRAMETGDPDLTARVIHPAFVNEEAADEPEACATPGPAGILATRAWLTSAFSELRWEVHEMVADGDRVMAHVTMTGRQTGPFVVFPAGGTPTAFPPTGRPFAVRQVHIFTLRDGRIIRHAAVRDDLRMMTQLGHLPPSGPGLIRMVRFTIGGGSKRAIRAVTEAAAAAADSVR